MGTSRIAESPPARTGSSAGLTRAVVAGALLAATSSALPFVGVLAPAPCGAAPGETVGATRSADLRALAARFGAEFRASRGPAYRALVAANDPATRRLRDAEGITLISVGPRGRPVYYTVNNLNAAKTVSTNLVWPGGGFGFSLTGSGTTLGQLAQWDEGKPLVTHQELGGRAVQIDFVGDIRNHSTHVAGTLIAGGVRAAARGMSQAASLACYDFANDLSEMATAALGGLRISNHSYGPATGWQRSGPDWYWFGDIAVDPVEDHLFGFYSDFDRDVDELARAAPYYLICFSAGNDRNDTGPVAGGTHFVFDGGTWVTSNDVRDPDGGTTGYDSVSWKKCAKNILVVGSIQDVPSGYAQPADVVMTAYSSWGPTDDGRIRPDLVANGVQVFSASSAGDTLYATLGGTSMATPNAAGSANLVAEYWETSHGGAPLTAAALRALLLQTADEAGTADGPDYEFGWGLLNTLAAVELAQADSAAPGHVHEAALSNGATDEYAFTHAVTGPFRATIAWADPPGTPAPPSVDPGDLMLVNDLDLRLVAVPSQITYEPWVLDPANPADPALPGDNFRDNVEQVHVASLPAGDFLLRVTHEGTLEDLVQDYALVSSASVTAAGPPTDVALPGMDRSDRLSVRPNPSHAGARLSLDLARERLVTVEIFDVQGRRVRLLERDRPRGPGEHVISWDGRDAAGNRRLAGLYFARVKTGHRTLTGKLVLLD